MEQRDREKIKKNLVKLVKGLTLDEQFIANLESENILTTSMVEELLVVIRVFSFAEAPVVSKRGCLDNKEDKKLMWRRTLFVNNLIMDKTFLANRIGKNS